MNRQEGLHRAHIKRVIRGAGVTQRLAKGGAVVLERVAYGGALWYRCPDLETLNTVEERVKSGSVLSFYFDERIADMQLRSDAASRAELMAKLVAILEAPDSGFHEALVGQVDADRVSVYVEYVTRVVEVEPLVASLPDGLTFYGTFPDRSNDGEAAITLNVPDPDGVVRLYPH